MFFFNSCFTVRKTNFRDVKNLAQSHIVLSGVIFYHGVQDCWCLYALCPASLKCPDPIFPVAALLFASMENGLLQWPDGCPKPGTKADLPDRKIPM